MSLNGGDNLSRMLLSQMPTNEELDIHFISQILQDLSLWMKAKLASSASSQRPSLQGGAIVGKPHVFSGDFGPMIDLQQ